MVRDVNWKRLARLKAVLRALSSPPPPYQTPSLRHVLLRLTGTYARTVREWQVVVRTCNVATFRLVAMKGIALRLTSLMNSLMTGANGLAQKLLREGLLRQAPLLPPWQSVIGRLLVQAMVAVPLLQTMARSLPEQLN